MPYEEKAEFAEPRRQAGVTLISMVAPTSTGRVQKIAREAEGFVYCVSSLGVTGVRSNLGSKVADLVAQVREANPEIPCAIGFGISTPEQARSMAKAADGGARRKLAHRSTALAWAWRILAVALAAAGVGAFVDLNIASYLFLQVKFVFVDSTIPFWPITAKYTLVAALFAVAGNVVDTALRTKR